MNSQKIFFYKNCIDIKIKNGEKISRKYFKKKVEFFYKDYLNRHILLLFLSFRWDKFIKR